MTSDDTPQGEETLGDDIRMIVGGVATLVLLMVPIILIRKLTRTIEEGEAFKKIEETLL